MNAIKLWLPESILTLMNGYSLRDFVSDVKAGLLVSVVAFPLFMTFAIASGVPPQVGLVTSIICGGLASLLGGAKFQIVGPTGAFTVIVFNIIQEHGFDGLLCASLIASIMLVAFGLLRLGNVVRYLPYPITAGFTAGIGLSIIIAQLGSFLGMSLVKMPASAIDKIMCYCANLNAINVYALLLGVGSLLFLQVMQHVKPNFPRYLCVLGFGVLYSLMFSNYGIEMIGSKFGEFSGAFSDPGIPNGLFSLQTVKSILPSAVTIAFLGGVENLLGAVISDNLSGKTHRPNLELLAQGIANFVGVLFGTIPATCALGTTSLNVKVGAKSPFAGLFNIIFLAMFMIFLGRFVQMIPMSCLSAMLLSAAWNMIALKKVKYILFAPKSDSVVFIATVVITVLFDIVFAIEVGLVLSTILFIRRCVETINIETFVQKDSLCSGEECEFVKINGNLFFGAAPILKNVLNNLPKEHKYVDIDMSNVAFIDVSGANELRNFVLQAQSKNIEVYITGVNDRIMRVLEKMDREQNDRYGHLTKNISM